MNNYQKQADRFNDHKNRQRLYDACISGLYDTGDLSNAAMGLSGECGEVVDIIKKYLYHETPLDKNHLKKELGDVMWYVALLCNTMGFDLDDVCRENIQKLEKRYPNGFNTYDANHRKENDI